MTKAIVGIIGGSGVYDLPGLEDVLEEWMATPWGEPSDNLRFGRIGTAQAVFLSRHGRGHKLSPSGINYRANIDALKRAGVTDIVSVSACGSFKPDIYPGHFVLVDQFVDRTFARQNSFFGNGCVAHVSMAHPVAPLLRDRIAAAAAAENIAFVNGGTYVCIEGPQFSSLAESLSYKAAGFDVIGMTAMPEAKLAREAEMSYATIAMATDFDCWHPKHDHVDVAAIIKVMQANAGNAAKLLARLLRDFPAEHEPCPIGSDRALDHALLTPPASRDRDLVKKLEAIMQRINRS
jgi:5'-methylthioadenosine phosphorylase